YVNLTLGFHYLGDTLFRFTMILIVVHFIIITTKKLPASCAAIPLIRIHNDSHCGSFYNYYNKERLRASCAVKKLYTKFKIITYAIPLIRIHNDSHCGSFYKYSKKEEFTRISIVVNFIIITTKRYAISLFRIHNDSHCGSFIIITTKIYVNLTLGSTTKLNIKKNIFILIFISKFRRFPYSKFTMILIVVNFLIITTKRSPASCEVKIKFYIKFKITGLIRKNIEVTSHMCCSTSSTSKLNIKKNSIHSHLHFKVLAIPLFRIHNDSHCGSFYNYYNKEVTSLLCCSSIKLNIKKNSIHSHLHFKKLPASCAAIPLFRIHNDSHCGSFYNYYNKEVTRLLCLILIVVHFIIITTKRSPASCEKKKIEFILILNSKFRRFPSNFRRFPYSEFTMILIVVHFIIITTKRFH
ncbi:hypothetical protein L9F63_003360, partial [Diploptera punctata]